MVSLGKAIESFMSGPDDSVSEILAALMERGIEDVLFDYGIPRELEGDDVRQRMRESGILITEMHPENAPQCHGMYIYADRQGELRPVAFVPGYFDWDAMKDKKFVLIVQRFDRNIEHVVMWRGERRCGGSLIGPRSA